MNKYLREPVNGITHMIGAVFSVFALIAMIIKVKTNNSDPIVYLSVLLFGIGMILLYSASATYHSIISNVLLNIFYSLYSSINPLLHNY